MRAKKKSSPAVKTAAAVAKKYKCGFPISPSRKQRVRKALYDVQKNKVPIRKAAEKHDLSYGFLHRRVSGQVEIEKRKGPLPIFSRDEEEAMAKWLSEMAERGMGLKPGEFLDFVEAIVRKENRSTPFKDMRPGHDWYYGFMARNAHIVQPRTETPLEMCRAKLTKTKTDQWYSKFRDFLIKKDLIEKPTRIWNADETGFSMGSILGKVIGPTRKGQVPHISGGHSKQRYTVMFCGAADGKMMPPFFIYPEPRPKGYNPLTGAIEGSDIAYTKKGWMDFISFRLFIEHFHKHAGLERPVVLLFDSVSSHVDMSAFEDAKEKGIALYRLLPNATHIMQPLDKGVFGPLKSRWHQVVRKHTREHPASPIGKQNFAEKLKEAFLLFYKPLTVINSFKSSGIFPVDGNVISADQLKTGLTFQSSPVKVQEDEKQTDKSEKLEEKVKVKGALEALQSVLDTPTQAKYTRRLQEGYNIQGKSPCFDAYKKLYDKTKSYDKKLSEETPVKSSEQTLTTTYASGLDLLADIATNVEQETEKRKSCTVFKSSISPVLKDPLVLPHVDESAKPKRKMLLDSLPDNLTSGECLRSMALKQLEKVKLFAEKERKAKEKYMSLKKSSTTSTSTKTSKRKGKRAIKQTRKNQKTITSPSPKPSTSTDDSTDLVKAPETIFCIGCHMSWEEDQELGHGNMWVQCDKCLGWLHTDCCTTDIPASDEEPFYCPECL